MAKKETIHFVITGGTIDSHWEVSKDTVVPLEKSAIPPFMSILNLYSPLKYTLVCLKDSRDLTKKDLKNIANTIEKSRHKKIIVTHGTYTMQGTATYLIRHLRRSDQTIIFTGSFIPVSGFAPTDAAFNLGYALAKAQDLPPGIYICMHGRVFKAGFVVKDVKKGVFKTKK